MSYNGKVKKGGALEKYGQRLADALGGVEEIGFPRPGIITLSKSRKLHICVDGFRVWGDDVTEMGLSVFLSDGADVLILGEVPLLAEEVDTAQRVLNDYGATVSALHNHWLSKPAEYFMHFQYCGSDPESFLDGISPWWSTL